MTLAVITGLRHRASTIWQIILTALLWSHVQTFPYHGRLFCSSPRSHLKQVGTPLLPLLCDSTLNNHSLDGDYSRTETSHLAICHGEQADVFLLFLLWSQRVMSLVGPHSLHKASVTGTDVLQAGETLFVLGHMSPFFSCTCLLSTWVHWKLTVEPHEFPPLLLLWFTLTALPWNQTSLTSCAYSFLVFPVMTPYYFSHFVDIRFHQVQDSKQTHFPPGSLSVMKSFKAVGNSTTA